MLVVPKVAMIAVADDSVADCYGFAIYVQVALHMMWHRESDSNVTVT